MNLNGDTVTQTVISKLQLSLSFNTFHDSVLRRRSVEDKKVLDLIAAEKADMLFACLSFIPFIKLKNVTVYKMTYNIFLQFPPCAVISAESTLL